MLFLGKSSIFVSFKIKSVPDSGFQFYCQVTHCYNIHVQIITTFCSGKERYNDHTVPTKSLETTCHFPITFHYNTMSYQI